MIEDGHTTRPHFIKGLNMFIADKNGVTFSCEVREVKLSNCVGLVIYDGDNIVSTLCYSPTNEEKAKYPNCHFMRPNPHYVRQMISADILVDTGERYEVDIGISVQLCKSGPNYNSVVRRLT